MKAPLNLWEYEQVDVYWYRELRAALAAEAEGRAARVTMNRELQRR